MNKIEEFTSWLDDMLKGIEEYDWGEDSQAQHVNTGKEQ